MARILYLYSQALRVDSPHARQTFQMLALLRDAGFTPDLLTLPGGDPWPEGLVERIYLTPHVPFARTLPPYGWGFRRFWATLVMTLTAMRLFLQHRYECVHCSDRAIRIGGWIAWLFGTRFTFEWRTTSGHDLIKWARWRTKRFRDAVGLVITDTPYSVPQLRESGLYGKIASIQALPLPNLHPLPLPSLRQPNEHRQFRIVAFTYTSNYRDLSHFFSALPAILKTPYVQVSIVGGTPAATERLRQTFTHHFSQEMFRLQLVAAPANAVDHLPLLNDADLVFLPVHGATIAPHLLLDVMALGRAILAIQCPAYTSLLNHQNAMLVNADALQIAEAVRIHLESPTLCTEHAQNVVETIVHERNPQSAISALRSCFTFILMEPRG